MSVPANIVTFEILKNALHPCNIFVVVGKSQQCKAAVSDSEVGRFLTTTPSYSTTLYLLAVGVQ